MNNKFIPIISVFMTISLIVFVSLQLYWIKELYTSLEQDFSNKVYSALETSTQKVNQIEVNKYWNDTYSNVGKEVLASSTNLQRRTSNRALILQTDRISFSKLVLLRNRISRYLQKETHCTRQNFIRTKAS